MTGAKLADRRRVIYYNTRHREEVGEINSVFYLVRSCFASFYQSLSYLSRISLGRKLTMYKLRCSQNSQIFFAFSILQSGKASARTNL